MPDYSKKPFKKAFDKRGPSRFNSSDRPRQMYKAECSNCHNQCEVPFRPNGVKPVFCSNCFNVDRDGGERAPRPSFNERPSFQKREFTPRSEFRPRTEAPMPDRRIDDLKRQMTNMEAKLDQLIKSMEKPAKPEVAVKEKKAAPAKKAKATKKK